MVAKYLPYYKFSHNLNWVPGSCPAVSIWKTSILYGKDD